MAKHPEQRYGFGPFELDPSRHLLLRQGEPVPLKPKVFDLLVLLVEGRGRLLGKDELMESLWKDRFVEDANLTQSIYELRKALEEDGDGDRYVVTVPRRGYRLGVAVEELPPHQGGEEVTGDPEAHLLFLECRHHWHKWTPEGWRRSIERGRRVIARDPSHAAAHAWMAASYCTLGISGAMPPREAFGRAGELVELALELDETLPEGHEVHGAVALFHDWDWQSAERRLSRALELDPGSGGARDLYALLRVVTGRPEEALREVRRAVEADPLSLLVNTDAGNVAYYARRFEAAHEQLCRALVLDPWFAHARMGLGHVYLQMRRLEEGLAEIELAVEHSGRDRKISGDLGYALALSGDRAGAEEILEALVERSADEYVDPYFPALVSVGLADPDRAFDWLDRAYEARSRELIYLRADPIFDPLRADPRFAELAERIGL